MATVKRKLYPIVNANGIIEHIPALMENYDANQFKVGSDENGIFKYKGTTNQLLVDNLRDQWSLQTSGLTNMHRTPFVQAEDLSWVNTHGNSLFSQTNNITYYATPMIPFNKYIQDDNLFFELSVAGYSKEDLEVTLEENILTVSSKGVKSDKEYLSKSVGTGPFTFTQGITEKLDVPYNADVKPTSKLENGILTIVLPLRPKNKITIQ